MNTDNHTKLYLSINHEGRVSLWDTPAAAASGKENGELDFQLALTLEQTVELGRQQDLARLAHGMLTPSHEPGCDLVNGGARCSCSPWKEVH